MLNDLAALYTANPALFAGSVFLLGLVIGSFLNVVIYRLPIMLERDWRAQAADVLRRQPLRRTEPAAGDPRALHLEHPPLRLPELQGADQGLAEHTGDQLAAAARALRLLQGQDLGALPAGGTGNRHLVGLGGLALRLRRARQPARLLVTWALIALTGIDIDHQLLPDSITLPLMWAGLLAAVVIGPDARAAPCPVSRKMPSSARRRAM